MGVLEFFGTLIKNDITASAIKSDFKQKMNINHFLIDFNSIIHVSQQKLIEELNNIFKILLKHHYQKINLNNQTLDSLLNDQNLMDLKSKINIDMPIKIYIKTIHEHLSNKKLDIMVIKRVISTLFYILRTIIEKDKLQTLLLTIDGVPSKGKMIEQKQRRYTGTFISKYNKKILNKHKKYLEQKENYLYFAKKYAIEWNRNKITPGTRFMERLIRYLTGNKIKQIFNNYFPNLKNYIVSDMHEIGEGEKKMVNYVNKILYNKIDINDNIVLYSPDADMILLAMLLPIKNLYIYKHNQQQDWYDLIDVKTCMENIVYYINNTDNTSDEIRNVNRFEGETNRVIYDLVYLSSIFGNDFVPKIESINVKQGFQNLINTYLTVSRKINTNLDKIQYLVKVNNNIDTDPSNKADAINSKFRINFTFLKQIIKSLLPIEEDFINNNKMYNTYINYAKMKYIFPKYDINENTINDIYHNFRRDYGDFQNAIRNKANLNRYIEDIEFINSLKKSLNISFGKDETTTPPQAKPARGGLLSDPSGREMINTAYMTSQEFVKLLIKYFKTYNNFPRINFNLDMYSHSIYDRYHANNIQNKIPDKNEYEIELYKFRNMLDEYYVKLNAQKLDLSKNKIEEYYKKYFNIRSLDDINPICEKYVEGLLWVFNYYFNDDSYINYWYYQYERAPLLNDIFKYLDTTTHDNFRSLFYNLNEYQVKNFDEYFNPVEQLIYVTPMISENIKLFPKEFRTVINKDTLSPYLKTLFIDLDPIIDNLFSNSNETNNLDIVDCRSMLFINKCILKNLHRLTQKEDSTFIKEIRKIKIKCKRTKSVIPSY
jgi:5'-3' exonuclease